MAVGKCSQYTDIDQDKVIIRFGDQEVYPVAVDETGLKQLSEYMRGDDVRIHVSLQIGQATSTVWGCDLTDGYVRINADYTTKKSSAQVVSDTEQLVSHFLRVSVT